MITWGAMAAPSQRTSCVEGSATPPVKKASRSAERTTTTTRINGPFPIRHPVCSRQYDNVRSSCHLLGTYPATTALLLNHRRTNNLAGGQFPHLAVERLLSVRLWDHLRTTLLWGDGSSDEPYAGQRARHIAQPIADNLATGANAMDILFCSRTSPSLLVSACTMDLL